MKTSFTTRIMVGLPLACLLIVLPDKTDGQRSFALQSNRTTEPTLAKKPSLPWYAPARQIAAQQSHTRIPSSLHPSTYRLASYQPPVPRRIAPRPVVSQPTYAHATRFESSGRRQFQTMYEGVVWYVQRGGNWYRERGTVTVADVYFFLNYESRSPAVMRLLHDAGYDGRAADDDRRIWEKTGQVWNFLRASVRAQRPGETVAARTDGWPSLEDHARFYGRTGDVAWAACFSKAHLFAMLLGRMGIPRERITIASAHHTESGAPPTASHVFVLLQVSGRWYYLDPTACHGQTFPTFDRRRSIGGLGSVDYQHPFKVLPLPGTAYGRVPLISNLRTISLSSQLQRALPRTYP